MSQVRENLVTGVAVADPLAGRPGISSGFSIPPIERCRLIFLGKPGCGKSTMIHGNPRAIIVDPECGGGSVARPLAKRFGPTLDETGKLIYQPTMKDYAAFIKDICAMKRAGKLPTYDTVGFDTFDVFFDILETDFCTRHKISSPHDYGTGQGGGWKVLREEAFDFLRQLYDAGFGVNLLCHVTSEVVRGGGGQSDLTIQSISFSQKMKESLKQWPDHVFEMSRRFVSPIGTDGKPTKPKECILLGTKNSGAWKAESTAGLKVRLPFPDEFIVPEDAAWETLALEYGKATELRKANFKEKPNA